MKPSPSRQEATLTAVRGSFMKLLFALYPVHQYARAPGVVSFPLSVNMDPAWSIETARSPRESLRAPFEASRVTTSIVFSWKPGMRDISFSFPDSHSTFFPGKCVAMSSASYVPTSPPPTTTVAGASEIR